MNKLMRFFAGLREEKEQYTGKLSPEQRVALKQKWFAHYQVRTAELTKDLALLNTELSKLKGIKQYALIRKYLLQHRKSLLLSRRASLMYLREKKAEIALLKR